MLEPHLIQEKQNDTNQPESACDSTSFSEAMKFFIQEAPPVYLPDFSPLVKTTEEPPPLLQPAQPTEPPPQQPQDISAPASPQAPPADTATPAATPQTTAPPSPPQQQAQTTPPASPPVPMSNRQAPQMLNNTSCFIPSKRGRNPSPVEAAVALTAQFSLLVINQKLYVFEGACYVQKEKDDALRFITEHLTDYWIIGKPKFADQVYDALMRDFRIARKTEQTNQRLLACRNGIVLDPQTGQIFAPLNHNDILTYYLDVDHNPSALNCPNFDQYLDRITGRDPIMKQRIWEILGYLLTNDNRGKCFFVFQGVANSGKSLLVRLIESFYPIHMQTVLPIESLSKNFSASKLHGRLLCTVPDMPNKPIDVSSASLIKQITGGDRISADVKNKERIDFKSNTRFVLTTNHPFITTVEEPALFDRLVLLPFAFTIPPEQRDPYLFDRICEERSAILNHALDAYRSLTRNNYSFSGQYPPNVVIDNPSRLMTPTANIPDCIEQFIVANIQPDPNGILFIDDLYGLFQSAYSLPNLTSAQFSKKFRKAISRFASVTGQRMRKQKEKNAKHALVGITLKNNL